MFQQMKKWAENAYHDCVLCPRRCHADRLGGGRGFCGQGAQIVAARASLHFWEEPCISGETGSGTVFFCGCSLGCVYCQNVSISGRDPRMRAGTERRILLPEELSEVFLSLEAQGACNINLVTPTHFAPGIAEAIGCARGQGLGIPVVWNTSGYESVETLKQLDGLVDIYLTDCKYHASVLSERYSKAPDYFPVCMEAIAEMVRQTGRPLFVSGDGREMDAVSYNEAVSADGGDGTEGADAAAGEPAGVTDYAGPLMKRGTIVRHLLLPGCVEDSCRVVDELLDAFGDGIYISLMNQYTPMPQVEDAQLKRRVTEGEYEELIGHALDAGLENGFFQAAGTDEESFIPLFDGRGL
ncbi:MAG: radical SAM protein [Lachnospiraceae bacterium]|nr:radical SAM protein [Lachnospiraceae bacterium]